MTDGLLIVSEKTCEEVVSRADAFVAVRDVFAAMARGDEREKKLFFQAGRE